MPEQYNARLDPDYERRAEAYRERHSLRKGQAAKRLMQAGLDAWEERDESHASAAMLEHVALALAVAGLVSFLAFWAAWSYFAWALVQPVLITGAVTACYLTGAAGASWTARRRSV